MTSVKPVVRQDRSALGLLDLHVQFFVDDLRAAGYAQRSLRKKRRVAASFVRWAKDKQVALADLDESHLTSFLDFGRL